MFVAGDDYTKKEAFCKLKALDLNRIPEGDDEKWKAKVGRRIDVLCKIGVLVLLPTKRHGCRDYVFTLAPQNV